MDKQTMDKLTYLINKKKTIPEIIESLGLEEYQVLGLIEILKNNGFMVEVRGDKVVKIRKLVRTEDVYTVSSQKDFMKILAISDSHLASKYDRLDILNYVYDEAIKKDVDFIVHCGDFTDGKSKRPEHVYELREISYEGQKEYCIDNYPKIDKPTYVIAGNHDLWWYKSTGSDIVKSICEERDDLIYLGSDIADLQVGQLKMRMIHGSKGNAYAMSYPLQRYMETISTKERPHILFRGHSHNSMFFTYQNMYAVQIPATIDQTPFARAQGMNTQRGVWWIDVEMIGKGKPITIKPQLETFGERKLIKKYR